MLTTKSFHRKRHCATPFNLDRPERRRNGRRDVFSTGIDMDLNAFKKHCESVILVDELPPLSNLRQKVAGCYDAFGMCPEGEIVALDVMGRVNCLKAEHRDGASLCEEDGSPCRVQAQPSDILGVIRLLRDFVVANFITKEGCLPTAEQRKALADHTVQGAGESLELAESDYTDEDRGVSRHLAESEKEKRRQG